MTTPKPDPKPGHRDNIRDQTAPGGRHQATGSTLGRPEQPPGRHQKGGGK